MMAELMARWRGLMWSREDKFGWQGDDGGGGNGEAKRRQRQRWSLYRAEKVEEIGERETVQMIVVDR
jgi:hypothetical protein